MAQSGNISAPVEDGKLVYDYSSKKKEQQKTSGSTLEYDQFLSLLCAEMQYQDPLEPTSNTEYVAQLATFSQLEAMLSMQTTQQNTMANALVGKYVILSPTDETTGVTSYVDGRVDYVMYNEDGSVMLSVNGKTYPLESLDTVADSEYYEAIAMSKSLTNMIAQLPELENITENYAAAIQQLRDIYNGMTSYQKGYVSDATLAKLKQYEDKIAELKPKTDDTKTEDSQTADTQTEDTQTEDTQTV